MKLPSSSSLLFATLAISSSSSSLAAPAGDAPNSNSEVAADSHHAHHRRVSTDARALAAEMANDSASDGSGILQIVGSIIDSLPILGPLLEPITDALGLIATSVPSEVSGATFSEPQLDELNRAAAEVSSNVIAVMNSTAQNQTVPVSPPPATGMTTALPAASSVNSSAGEVRALAAPSLAPPVAANISVPSPMSPSLPAQPPNTPALPMTSPPVSTPGFPAMPPVSAPSPAPRKRRAALWESVNPPLSAGPAAPVQSAASPVVSDAPVDPDEVHHHAATTETSATAAVTSGTSTSTVSTSATSTPSAS